MNEAIEHIEQPTGTTAEEAGRTEWQAPGYTIVDTALEVTAYSLNVR
ncbi:pyrroloquinoline quinone precursor peptide PqqA [Streptomyces sp. NPDC048710]